ncbi:Hypothetical protein SRAE_2000141400 [Strongyloides ratti]|uniref:Uncharacterized protein n=1 Tax=Strongyloides ratti TaxID=34506 RepID=A0A090LF50_STRRB|nr:Hypothetical protein SRAE_2000141400 [Strongyloides ratti]CEF66748.1 Hypothetical protein SRAE_2000141400 [Strongyloides ratti]
MITRILVIYFIFSLLLLKNVESIRYYIYKNTSSDRLEAAQQLGEEAKISYIKRTMNINDEMAKRNLYLQGLEICNSIDSDEAVKIQQRTSRESRYRDWRYLQQMGLKEFQAQFMTLPLKFMTEITHMACSKHEQQLQCGSRFEGPIMIEKRIVDLKQIGNHKMMFNKECNDPNYVPSIYPCIGKFVKTWSGKCLDKMNTYWEVQKVVNSEISNIYETALNTVKALSLKHNVEHPLQLQTFVFNNAFKKISKLEGKKCEKFKMMRDCVLPALERQCGTEAKNAMETAISVGYLRTERHERLNMDFVNLNFPTDYRCSGL